MRAFFDIDTQIDFLFPAGALYGKGGENLIAPVASLNHYAIDHKISLISTTCAHPEDAAEFSTFPPHCIKGTVGQLKPPALLAPSHFTVPNRQINIDARGAQQILLEKNDLDLFTNPNTEDLLRQLGATDCIVYGAFTEYCVRCAVNGLLRLGHRVSLVTDAIGALDDAKGDEVIRSFTSAGGILTTRSQVMR